MKEETVIEKIEWSAPEYNHKERTTDWFWGIALIAIITLGIAIWFKNYLFAIFVAVSGACIFIISLRKPREVNFMIDNDGITMGKTLYPWQQIKGFNIKKSEPYHKLLIETTKYFLPVYTIPVPESLSMEAKSSLAKILPIIETLDESQSVQFMEKLGF